MVKDIKDCLDKLDNELILVKCHWKYLLSQKKLLTESGKYVNGGVVCVCHEFDRPNNDLSRSKQVVILSLHRGQLGETLLQRLVDYMWKKRIFGPKLSKFKEIVRKLFDVDNASMHVYSTFFDDNDAFVKYHALNRLEARQLSKEKLPVDTFDRYNGRYLVKITGKNH